MPASPRARRPAAQQLRREVGDDLVDAARLDERAGQGRAAFEQDVTHTTVVQRLQREAGHGGVEHQRLGRASSTRAVCGVRCRRSSTTRSGWCSARPPSPSRTVSCGSSASTVPLPTTIASTIARSACASARDAAEEIHRALRSAAATRPSRVAAYFQVTNGRPLRTACSQGRSAPAAAASAPHARRRPRRRRSRSRGAAAGGLGVRVVDRVDDPARRRRRSAPRCTARSARCARTVRG